MFGSFLPSLWSLSNQSLLGSENRRCAFLNKVDVYVIYYLLLMLRMGIEVVVIGLNERA